MTEQAPDYATIRDDVILLLGDAARRNDKTLYQLDKFVATSSITCPADWISKIAHELDRKGFGRGEYGPSGVRFYPSGACIAAADEIRAGRTLIGKIRRVSRGDWIALVSLAVSIAAFVISVLAYLKV